MRQLPAAFRGGECFNPARARVSTHAKIPAACTRGGDFNLIIVAYLPRNVHVIFREFFLSQDDVVFWFFVW